MTHITESVIEEFSIQLLERLGWDYKYGPDIASDSDNRERLTFNDVILMDRLLVSACRINPHLQKETIISGSCIQR